MLLNRILWPPKNLHPVQLPMLSLYSRVLKRLIHTDKYIEVMYLKFLKKHNLAKLGCQNFILRINLKGYSLKPVKLQDLYLP